MNETKHQQLHFLTHSSKEAGDWPFFQNMQRPGITSKVFGNSVSLQYPHRVWLYLIGWPRLFISGWRLAGDSIKALEADTIVTAHDHILLLTYKLRRFFSFKSRQYPQTLVLHGFIYTPRTSRLLNQMRRFYFRSLLHGLAMVICHSKHEVGLIQSLVDTRKTKVVAVHFGIGEGATIKAWLRGYIKERKDDQEHRPYSIVSAGRSSRDYETLVAAVKEVDLDIICHIICDNIVTAPKALENERVQIHRTVYNADYSRMLLSADIVAIPLSEGDISAGQMVLLHALAAGKPVIITATPTSNEYVEESALVKLVAGHDVAAFRTAIEEIAAQLPLTYEKRQELRQLFDERFSDHAHGRQVFEVYKQYLFH